MGDRRAGVSVNLKTADGPWQSLGREIARGVFPEGVVLTANEGGPDTASFALRRKSSVPWPDLAAFNQLDHHIGGLPVWGGRVWEAPLSDTGDEVIQVQARGWQYHLDDDLLQRLYVHTDLSAYRDQRSFPSAPLTSFFAGPQVQTGSGVITMVFPDNYTVAVGEGVGVTIDLGASLAKRAVVTWERVGGAHGGIEIYSRGSTSENAFTAGDDSNVNLGVSAGGTIAHTFGAARRYHHVFLYFTAGAGTFGADQGARITSIQLFGETAYESGNASVLKADQVLEDVLASGALPLLDSRTDRIAAGAFSIPDLAPAGYQTPRAIIAAANAYEGNLIGVDADRRLFSRERATVPSVEIGAWPGSSFQDASTNSAEALYNRVIVTGTTPDGAPVNEVRTAPSSLLTRQGFTRTATLAVSAPLSTTAAQTLGDIWLGDQANPKFKGTATVTGHGGARNINGGDVHASELLLRCGQQLRVGHLIDPATGALGRDATIRSVQYVHDTETATVELDNERGNFATLLERLGANVSAALR